MKKLTKFLVPFLLINSVIFSGCKNKNTDSRVHLTFGDVHAEATTEIQLDRLQQLVDEQESFLLVVNSTTCVCWNDFEPNLNAYLKENKAICYRIDFSTIQNVATKYGLIEITKSTTTFAIFERGTLKTTLRTANDGKIMYDKEKFFKYMNENVRLPNCLFINKDDVATIKESGKNAVIYYERTGCGDCSYLNPTILYSYINNHKDCNKIYVLDCQPYFGQSNYQSVKDEVGMSVANNPVYGYGNGVFPYFSYIENNTYASGAVIYNDVVEKQDDKFVITNSYYTSETVASLQYTDTVILGKELTADEVNTPDGRPPSWDHEAANKVYGSILNSFLDFALPKVTFNF